MLGAIRSNGIDVALLVHVAGAMVLLGGLVTASAAGLIGWRDATATLRRFSYKTFLLAAFPGWIVMRIGGEWTYSKEHLDALPEDPTWVGIGFITSDIGGLLMLIALIVGGIGLWRARRGGGGLLKVSAVIAPILVALYVIAIWAMGAKPT